MLKLPIAFLTLIALSACSRTTIIDSAYAARQPDGRVSVYVKIDVNELRSIMKDQYYFSIVVAECDSRAEIYPIRPYIDGIEAAEFPEPKTGMVYGTLPRRVFDTARKPCAYLRGGSYFSGGVNSDMVPIKIGLR